MAISIDRVTNVISVPQSDLTFVSGTFYRLDTRLLWEELKQIEASEEGIIFPDTQVHNSEYTVAGATYAESIQIIPPYSIEFTPDTQYTVELINSNNNIFDVGNAILVQNQVQVIPTNSAGLVVEESPVNLTKGFR